MTADDLRTLLSQAAELRQRGQSEDAVEAYRQALALAPGHPAALNGLGLALLHAGRAPEAAPLFVQATQADPGAPPLWLNLAEAYRNLDQPQDEVAALDRALAIDAYLLPAMLRKAQALERMARLEESAETYRGLLAATRDQQGLPDGIAKALAHGQSVVEAIDARRAARFQEPLEQVLSAYAGADMHRALAYAEHKAGRRRIYQQQPTAGHFPFLPAIEFFDRERFPWFEAAEAATPDIQRELHGVWRDGSSDFRPYVQYDPTQPVNQWEELNHSPRWSAWFLWRDGVRQEENCRRCPKTAAMLDKLPLLDIPGKAPSVMFSILAPKTRIPPHTGSTNVRVTIHLPLVVPPGCGFRVGAETRTWEVGRMWAFDDTIEHEAWNNSDQPRAILILDGWNPLLSEAEKAAVRVIG